MGQKKFRNPYLTKRQQMDPAAARIVLASHAAMQEYNQRVHARKMIATDEELKREYAERDSWMESWLYGCMAVVLHRRYKFTAPKLVEILNEIQALHEQVMFDHPECENYAEVNKYIAQLVWDECHMKVFDNDFINHN